MENLTACKFCGQAFMVDGESESERMRAAIATCNCLDALAVKRKWRYINAAKIKLTEVFSFNPFGENAQIAVEDECVQAIEENLERFIPYLVDFNISQIQINIAGFGKISLSTDSEGKVKIKKSVSANFESKV